MPELTRVVAQGELEEVANRFLESAKFWDSTANDVAESLQARFRARADMLKQCARDLRDTIDLKGFCVEGKEDS